MSWTLTIQTTKRTLFDGDVDRARENPPGAADPDDLAAAKELMKVLAKRVQRPFIYAQASRCDRQDDSIHVSVFGEHVGDHKTD